MTHGQTQIKIFVCMSGSGVENLYTLFLIK